MRRDVLGAVCEALVERRGLKPDSDLIGLCICQIELAPKRAPGIVCAMLGLHATAAGRGGIKARKEFTRLTDAEVVFVIGVVTHLYKEELA
jgi:hypothetical protein